MPRADEMHSMRPPPPVGSLLPLTGITILAVEDSRYASDALRLMCQRSGARLRRAESLHMATAHLRLYRPDLIIVDLGLPDGRGEDLIRRLKQPPSAASDAAPADVAFNPGWRDCAVLGSSGDPAGRRLALAAGADGFIEKPLPDLGGFQAVILSILAGRPAFFASCRAQSGKFHPQPMADRVGVADPLALQDDLAQAERVLRQAPDRESRDWLAGFLSGLAQQTKDSDLAAATRAICGPDPDFAPLASLLRRRIENAPDFTTRQSA